MSIRAGRRTGVTNVALQEMVSVDNDIKFKVNQYNTTKTNLTALERQRT